MSYIKGKLRKTIYYNEDNGYVVALFRVKETDDEALQEYVNKTITVTGNLTEVKIDLTMLLYGEMVQNEKFGKQYKFTRFEIAKPTTKEAMIEFLASNFVQSCGEKTAKNIVEVLGEGAIDQIKEEKEVLLKVPGITLTKATKIHESLVNFAKSSDVILTFQNFGFSIEECAKIYNRFKDNIEGILNDDFYDLKEIIDFAKIDQIYLQNYGETVIRQKACILESMEILANQLGDTFSYLDEINLVLQREFQIFLSEEDLTLKLSDLIKEKRIYQEEKRYYLAAYYEAETNIARNLRMIDQMPAKKIPNLATKLEKLAAKSNMTYNADQQKAIISALENNITIISGGPGTGKTTIINAIVQLYIAEYKLSPVDIMERIALLAPTGRASKKMAMATHLPAYTIHRYLKWNKDRNNFFYNEDNKTTQELIIVDEVSMIDVKLFDALLRGINWPIKLILVGDIFQLPSVGPGLVLNDLISTDLFNYAPLNIIYRQSSNSYIPYLAKEIKNVDLSEEFLNKKDDYAFFAVEANQIKNTLEQIINYSREKGIDEKNMQVLVPMYKGENGIDNLNRLLQDIYNPHDPKKLELIFGDVVYRENDKVLQLVNDLDHNVFNGDIGYIMRILGSKVTINFDGNVVTYEKHDLKQIKHAYAITIHKSQGSEFDHVIFPVCHNYYKMLYNKLVYTAVSRAKKTLTIIGESQAFAMAVRNNFANNRKTSLQEKIHHIYEV